MATHGIQWLPYVDKIVVLDENEITEIGSYEELMAHNGPFAEFLRTHINEEDSSSDEVEEGEQNISPLPIYSIALFYKEVEK